MPHPLDKLTFNIMKHINLKEIQEMNFEVQMNSYSKSRLLSYGDNDEVLGGSALPAQCGAGELGW